MNKKYTITLREGSIYETTYRSTIVPAIGDTILLSETRIFIVEKRTFSTTNDESVALNGKIL